MSAFYRRDGDGFASTELTIGPWSVEHQHAGPPAALLARELQCLTEGMPIVRITYEIHEAGSRGASSGAALFGALGAKGQAFSGFARL